MDAFISVLSYQVYKIYKIIQNIDTRIDFVFINKKIYQLKISLKSWSSFCRTSMFSPALFEASMFAVFGSLLFRSFHTISSGVVSRSCRLFKSRNSQSPSVFRMAQPVSSLSQSGFSNGPRRVFLIFWHWAVFLQ